MPISPTPSYCLLHFVSCRGFVVDHVRSNMPWFIRQCAAWRGRGRMHKVFRQLSSFLSWHSLFFVVVCFPSPLLTTSYPQDKVLSSNNCRPPRPPWTFSNPRALRACLHRLTAFQTRPSRSDKNMNKTICSWAHRMKTGRICIAASRPATSLWYVSTWP